MCSVLESRFLRTLPRGGSSARWRSWTALSIPNIVYILRKELDPVKTKQVIDQLSLLFSIEDLKAEDLKKAAAMQPRDYEDALQMVCASRIKADFIVTRNIKDFLISKVPAVTPSELLARI